MANKQILLPELLAPAGSPAALRAAVEAGADAVYLGASSFNARANAANFGSNELKASIEYAHSKGAKVHVTLNTLIYDRELPDFLKTAEDAYLAGADAFIIADTGAIPLIKKHFPDIELHGSTQMSVHSSGSLEAVKQFGLDRVVLARELDLDNIKTVSGILGDIETEIFIHGALCVCHSGQCLFSSVVGGRSGNRGECAQPCRLPYKGNKGNYYPLSLKDLCLGNHITELLDSGVASLKIEGRMKSPNYVTSVVSVYRALLDERRNATNDEIAFLSSVFSRDGFTDRYFTGSIAHSMLGTRPESAKEAKSGSMPASSRLHKASVRKPVVIERSGPVLPLPERFQKPEGKRSSFRSAVMYDPAQYTSSAREYFKLCYIPLEKYAGAVKSGNAPKGVLMPPVIFDSEYPEISDMLSAAVAAGATDVLCGNIGHLPLLKDLPVRIHGDFRLNICNNGSAKTALDLGFSDYILSPELTLPRIRDIGGPATVITYGRLPLMITEKCAGKECGSCKDCEHRKNKLTDRMGVSFPVLRAFKHRSLIFNSVPVYMADKQTDLKNAGITSSVAIFTTETPKETDAVISALKKGLPYPLKTSDPVRRIKSK